MLGSAGEGQDPRNNLNFLPVFALIGGTIRKISPFRRGPFRRILQIVQ